MRAINTRNATTPTTTFVEYLWLATTKAPRRDYVPAMLPEWQRELDLVGVRHINPSAE